MLQLRQSIDVFHGDFLDRPQGVFFRHDHIVHFLEAIINVHRTAEIGVFEFIRKAFKGYELYLWIVSFTLGKVDFMQRSRQFSTSARSGRGIGFSLGIGSVLILRTSAVIVTSQNKASRSSSEAKRVAFWRCSLRREIGCVRYKRCAKHLLSRLRSASATGDFFFGPECRTTGGSSPVIHRTEEADRPADKSRFHLRAMKGLLLKNIPVGVVKQNRTGAVEDGPKENRWLQSSLLDEIAIPFKHDDQRCNNRGR